MKYTFLLFLLILVACSKNYEKNIAEADKLIEQRDFKKAVELLKEAASSNDEKISSVALRKLGVIYQQNNLPEVDYNESQLIAQQYFYKVFEKFPKSPEAPKSLFMSAYLLANELKQFDEATKQYNLFLENFPTDELAAPAKIELENIGLSPEEILKKNINNSNAN